MFISPILVVVVVVVVQFQTLYLKNHKEFKSETLHTGWVPWWDVQSPVKGGLSRILSIFQIC